MSDLLHRIQFADDQLAFKELYEQKFFRLFQFALAFVRSKLIAEEIGAGFYNIDVDTSTLVDLSQPTLDEQQRANFERAAEITAFIRGLEPEGVTASVGAEIGEVGMKNSTVEELHAFMRGYNRSLAALGRHAGISKISVQTGTSHGGVVLPDGSIADVKLDLQALAALSRVAREEYGLAGLLGDEIAVGLAQCRAGADRDILPARRLDEGSAERFEPGPAVLVGQRGAVAHFLDIGLRMILVAIEKRRMQRPPEGRAHGRFTRRADAHHDDDAGRFRRLR